MIVRSREFLNESGIPTEKMMKSCVKEHRKQIERWNRLDKYFQGEHTTIINRKMKSEFVPNNKLVCNHARVITVTASSHMIGQPVKYTPDDDIAEAFQPIQDLFRTIDMPAVDSELEQDCSVFGKAVELVFMSADDIPVPKSTQIDPRNGFVVYDDTVERRRMFGVHYFLVKSEEGENKGFKLSVHCPTVIKNYSCEELDGDWKDEGDTENYFGNVSMHEYLNNEEEKGDFEGQIELIDAYNMLQSDRINDKEAFVDAIMFIKGQTFGDDLEEASKTIQLLRQLRLLELDTDGEAGYLTKQLVESDVDILKRSISEDIHRFSMVPNVSDENFAGNASGVAMAYKLLLLEELTKIKERYFRKGLKERLKLFSQIYAIKSKGFDVGKVDIAFNHSLPLNQAETASIVAQLAGIVPDELLYGLLWFVSDPQETVKKMKEQKEEAAKFAQEAFGEGLPQAEDKKPMSKKEREDDS